MSDYVVPGFFQVDVDYEHVRPQVDYSLADYESVFGYSMLSADVPIFSDPGHMFYMYFVTRPGYSPSYVMRLPRNFTSLNLPNMSMKAQWLTFSTMSVLEVSVETSGSAEQVKACVADVAHWLNRMTSYSDLLQLDDAAPNVATVLCSKDQPLLRGPVYMDVHGMPDWRVSLSSFGADETCVFQADVGSGAGAALPALPVPTDVQHVLANLHAHALFTLFPHVLHSRMHFEKRPPTPPRSVLLEEGDVVVYLNADHSQLLFAQVVGTDALRPYWLQLHNAEEPQCLAKFSTATQALESPLQVLHAFVPGLKRQ